MRHRFDGLLNPPFDPTNSTLALGNEGRATSDERSGHQRENEQAHESGNEHWVRSPVSRTVDPWGQGFYLAM
ncbi:MAG: hypothetical protein JWM10_640 [Myxococcaceae bacterium]|nr:hypothetical protein [Myxococcaceae bacterium]